MSDPGGLSNTLVRPCPLPSQRDATVAFGEELAVLCRREIGAGDPLTQDESEALSTIYRRYGPMLFAVARRITRETEAAEDVVHEVFLRLPRIAAQYRGAGVGGWLKQVTARQALMHLRASKSRREEAIDEGTRPNCLAPTGESSDTRLDRDELTWVLRLLPASLRRVVELRVLHDYSHAEIGRVLGISRTASEVRYSRAVKLIRQRVLPNTATQGHCVSESLVLAHAS